MIDVKERREISTKIWHDENYTRKPYKKLVTEDKERDSWQFGKSKIDIQPVANKHVTISCREICEFDLAVNTVVQIIQTLEPLNTK